MTTMETLIAEWREEARQKSLDPEFQDAWRHADQLEAALAAHLRWKLDVAAAFFGLNDPSMDGMPLPEAIRLLVTRVITAEAAVAASQDTKETR